MQRFKVHSHSQAVFPYSQESTTGSLQYHTTQPNIGKELPNLSLVEHSTFQHENTPTSILSHLSPESIAELFVSLSVPAGTPLMISGDGGLAGSNSL